MLWEAKNTFKWVTGFALLLLLAFYGYGGHGNQAIRSAVNQEHNGLQEKVVNPHDHITASGNSKNELKDKKAVTNHKEVEERFKARREHYSRLCSGTEYQNITRSNYITSITSSFANNRLHWCQIPKIATTFLKYVRRKNAPSLKGQHVTKYSRGRQKSFFLVREPYSRLVSGFLCKIVTTPQFWRRYGKDIISDYRPDASKESKRCGHDVSFPEFIKYFIKAQKTGLNKNKHFSPIHEQCSICRKNYDYIVHLETLIPDLSYIFASAEVKMVVDIRDTENEILSKSTSMMKEGNRTNGCYFPCQFLNTLWWSFQARGFISADDKFPLGDEECKTASVEKFTGLATKAYQQFTDKKKRSKQKRDIMIDLYHQLPLADRLELQKILWKDFKLFEFEPAPQDVFPEMVPE